MSACPEAQPPAVAPVNMAGVIFRCPTTLRKRRGADASVAFIEAAGRVARTPVGGADGVERFDY